MSLLSPPLNVIFKLHEMAKKQICLHSSFSENPSEKLIDCVSNLSARCLL